MSPYIRIFSLLFAGHCPEISEKGRIIFGLNLTLTVLINIELQKNRISFQRIYLCFKNIGVRPQNLFLPRPVMQGRRFVVNKQAPIKVRLKIGEVLLTKLRPALGSCF